MEQRGLSLILQSFFCREEKEKQANSVNIIGATPLDFFGEYKRKLHKKWLLDNGFSVQSCFAMDRSLDEISAAPQAAVSLVISSDGIAAAKYLLIPMECHMLWACLWEKAFPKSFPLT